MNPRGMPGSPEHDEATEATASADNGAEERPQVHMRTNGLRYVVCEACGFESEEGARHMNYCCDACGETQLGAKPSPGPGVIMRDGPPEHGRARCSIADDGEVEGYERSNFLEGGRLELRTQDGRTVVMNSGVTGLTPAQGKQDFKLDLPGVGPVTVVGTGIAPVADEAALRALDVTQLNDGDVCAVQTTGEMWRWDATDRTWAPVDRKGRAQEATSWMSGPQCTSCGTRAAEPAKYLLCKCAACGEVQAGHPLSITRVDKLVVLVSPVVHGLVPAVTVGFQVRTDKLLRGQDEVWIAASGFRATRYQRKPTEATALEFVVRATSEAKAALNGGSSLKPYMDAVMGSGATAAALRMISKAAGQMGMTMKEAVQAFESLTAAGIPAHHVIVEEIAEVAGESDLSFIKPSTLANGERRRVRSTGETWVYVAGGKFGRWTLAKKDQAAEQETASKRLEQSLDALLTGFEGD
jgi:predicted RNA-binding Zn-ribbon protein involved in translation (DUF1610 family)